MKLTFHTHFTHLFNYFVFALISLIFTACTAKVAQNPDSTNQLTFTPSASQVRNDFNFTLISTGDIGLVRDINAKVVAKNDPTYPFSNIADYLNHADLTITNLEGPLIEKCPIILTGFKFCGQSVNAKGLKFSGIDAASLANNHSTNYGQTGLKQTIDALSQEGITPFGTGDTVTYFDINGRKIALIGFVELGNKWAGLNNATEENVAELVKRAKTTADVVVVSFHWGPEYVRKPSDNMVKLAHLAIDNGADLILGNHSHWIMDTQEYKNVFISYGQGNTIFDQDWSQETKEGILYKFDFRDDKFSLIERKFTVIEDNSRPRMATEEESQKILSKLTK